MSSEFMRPDIITFLTIFKASSRYIQEEHLLASHGEYMTFIEGRRAAEDDEHTEVFCPLSDMGRG